MRVKFLRDELYEHLGRGRGHTFRKDEVYDFESTFADRWIRRNAAEEIGGAGKEVVLIGTAGPFVPVNGAKAAKPAPAPAQAKEPKAPKATPRHAEPVGPGVGEGLLIAPAETPTVVAPLEAVTPASQAAPGPGPREALAPPKPGDAG